MTKAMKAMNKYDGEKRPRGRPPAGAILVDGKWQLTEPSTQLFAERLRRHRELSRSRWRAKQELLRISHPELFVVRGIDPRQTTLTPEVRSTERNVDPSLSQKSDTSSTPPATSSTPACFGVHCSATMALQVFRADQHLFEVTTVTVDQVVWFKGREVAACLEYANPQKALRDHVDRQEDL